MAIFETQCYLQQGNAPPQLHQWFLQSLVQDHCISVFPEEGVFCLLPASFEGDGETCCCLERHEVEAEVFDRTLQQEKNYSTKKFKSKAAVIEVCENYNVD